MMAKSKKEKDWGLQREDEAFIFSNKQRNNNVLFSLCCILPLWSEILHCAVMKAKYRKKHNSAPDMRFQLNEVTCQLIKSFNADDFLQWLTKLLIHSAMPVYHRFCLRLFCDETMWKMLTWCVVGRRAVQDPGDEPGREPAKEMLGWGRLRRGNRELRKEAALSTSVKNL